MFGKGGWYKFCPARILCMCWRQLSCLCLLHDPRVKANIYNQNGMSKLLVLTGCKSFPSGTTQHFDLAQLQVMCNCNVSLFVRVHVLQMYAHVSTESTMQLVCIALQLPYEPTK